ncbi:hypothetical protein [Streptomyces sp. Ac-502]|uniref:hypothetical protein n=1 Tax=Streptomyces sp. Ac-502 TaxID=3342801 RepID=UPI003862BF28
MITRPRSLLFWLLLIIALFLIAKAPVETAHALLAVYHAVVGFFVALGVFFTVLASG